MIIYFVMVEAVPNHSNPESKEYSGAYINCWVKADTPADAVKKAKEYIRENEKNFTQISDELGFTSIHYFSRLFKKKTGMTLTEYRSSVIYPSE